MRKTVRSMMREYANMQTHKHAYITLEAGPHACVEPASCGKTSSRNPNQRPVPPYTTASTWSASRPYAVCNALTASLS